MTLVGDVAQSTTPAGQERWSEVFAHLGPAGSKGIVADPSIGYRIPEPILRIANRLLPLNGVVAPATLHEPIIAALADHDLVGTDHVHNLERAEVAVFTAEAVKGLEFDGVIVVNPHEILHENGDEPTPRGARLLYVAITRAVQQVEFVTDPPAPPVIAP